MIKFFNISDIYAVVTKFYLEEYADRIAFVARAYYDAIEKYGFEIYEEISKSKK